MDSILIGIGLDADMSRNAHSMILSMIPAIFLQSVNEMSKNLLIAQGIYKPFVYINLVVFAFFPIGGYYLIWKSGLGIMGFGIFKFMVESINFIGIALLYKYKAHKESLRRESLKEVLGNGFGRYTKNFFKILLGWYADYLGFETNTIFLGLIKNNHIMAAWVSIMNICGIGYVLGSGMAMYMRTITSTLIGQEKMLEAKKFGKMCWVLNFLYCVVHAILLITCASGVSNVYTNIDDVKIYLIPMIRLAGVVQIFCGMGATCATLLRVVGKACILSVINAVDQILIWDSISALGLYVWGMGPNVVMWGFICGYCLTIVIGTTVAFKFNWNRIPRVDK